MSKRVGPFALACAALATTSLAFVQGQAADGSVPPATQPLAGASGATGSGAGQPPSFLDGIMGTLPLLAMMGVVFYFIMWRPDQKRRKERDALLASLKKGDRVVLASGLYGSIVQVQDTVVTLQVAEGVRMRYARSAVQSVLAGDEGSDS